MKRSTKILIVFAGASLALIILTLAAIAWL
jgi:hypothetical protein